MAGGGGGVSEQLEEWLKDPAIRKVLNSLLLETEFVYRRKPRELIYVRRKPAERGGPTSKLAFSKAAFKAFGSKMTEDLPPAAELVRREMKGKKYAPPRITERDLAFLRDVQRLTGMIIAHDAEKIARTLRERALVRP